MTAGVLFTLAACQAKRPDAARSIPSDPDQHLVFVYLDPLPAGPEGLELRIDSVSAVREDGPASPLTLAFDRVVAGKGARERLLASGGVPAGRYTELELRFAAAAAAGEEGRTDLAVPPEGTRTAVHFVAERGRSTVLRLKLDPRTPASGEVRFEPLLAAAVPDRLATGLTGLAVDREAGAVFLFDKVAGQVVGAVRTGRRPGGMAVDLVRARAYVPVGGEDAIVTIDVAAGAVIDRIPLTGGDDPAEVVLSPDGSTLLCANAGSGTVSIVDARSLFETRRVTVGNAPRSLLLDAAGTRAFVFNSLSDSISVLDVAAGTLVATLAADSGPLRGAFDRAQRRLYVINRSSPYLTVFDPVSLSIVKKVYVGAGATALAVDPRTDRIYLSRRNTGSVEIYDPQSFLPVDTMPAPGEVAHLAVDRQGNLLYLSLSRSRTVRAVRLVGQGTVWDADLPGEPSWVSLMGER